MLSELSIFVRNRAVELDGALQALAAAGVNILTFSITQVEPYNIVRIICDEPTRAYQELLDRSFVFESSQVFALKLSNRPGTLDSVVRALGKAGVTIEHGYQTMLPGTEEAVVVLKTNDIEATRRVIAAEKFEDLDHIDLR